MHRVSASILSVASLLAGAVLLLPPAVASAPRPVRISPAIVFDAPTGGKGGITNAVVWCRNYRVEARTTMTIINLDTGWRRTHRWRGSLPGYWFPRVVVGHYKVKTVGRCGAHVASRVQRLRITEKTAGTTISREEFDTIRRGMSRAEVRAIVGNDGRDPYTYRRRTTRIYDMMPFWRWSNVTYRDGLVVGKYWNVAHD